jgi:solute carrier family 41
MTQVDQLIIIIPVMLNLKGNLEMNLSARLGTAANLGELDKPDAWRKVILGNLLLLQVQAAVVSFVAACVAFILGLILPSAHIPLPSATDSIAPTNIPLVFRQLISLQPRLPRPYIPPHDIIRHSGFRESVLCKAWSGAWLNVCKGLSWLPLRL